MLNPTNVCVCTGKIGKFMYQGVNDRLLLEKETEVKFLLCVCFLI